MKLSLLESLIYIVLSTISVSVIAYINHFNIYQYSILFSLTWIGLNVQSMKVKMGNKI